LGEAIVNLLTSASERERLAQEGLDDVSRYHLRALAAAYEAIYGRFAGCRTQVSGCHQ
jgi:hypothetical protein